MPEWFKESWWLIWAIACGICLVVYRVHKFRNDDRPERLLYALAPSRDPENEEYKRRPIQFLLWCIGIVVIFVAFGLEKLFTWWTTR